MLACKVFGYANSMESHAGGFVDGYTAPFLMFRKIVRYPGSESMELLRLTTPEILTEYRAISPGYEEAILRIREESLDLDRRCTLTVRIVGGIELAAILVSFVFSPFIRDSDAKAADLRGHVVTTSITRTAKGIWPFRSYVGGFCCRRTKVELHRLISHRSSAFEALPRIQANLLSWSNMYQQARAEERHRIAFFGRTPSVADRHQG